MRIEAVQITRKMFFLYIDNGIECQATAFQILREDFRKETQRTTRNLEGSE